MKTFLSEVFFFNDAFQSIFESVARDTFLHSHNASYIQTLRFIVTLNH